MFPSPKSHSYELPFSEVLEKVTVLPFVENVNEAVGCRWHENNNVKRNKNESNPIAFVFIVKGECRLIFESNVE